VFHLQRRLGWVEREAKAKKAKAKAKVKANGANPRKRMPMAKQSLKGGSAETINYKL
jgi:hypothetical protein